MRGGLVAFAILIIISLFINGFKNPSSTLEKITYEDFLAKVEDGKVESIYYDKGVKDVKGEFKDGEKFIFRKPVDDFDEKFMLQGIQVHSTSAELGKNIKKVVINLIGYVIIFTLFMFFIGRIMKGAMKGQTQALDMKIPIQVDNDITFDDVAGNEEAKEELQDLVEFLKNPHKFKRYGAKVPKGTLLTGPPGNGKTLMAKALAGEAGVPFLALSGSDFVQMYVGLGANRVRSLFEEARKLSPCIIFIDEIDALGRKRSKGGHTASDERDQTLNQLLVEMDGFNSDEGIMVVGATNRAELLDDALLRPGRFDRQTSVSLPDLEAREKILKIHSEGKPLGEDVDLGEVAKLTIYMSGADLMNVMNEASIYAAKSNHKKVTMDDINKAVNKVLVGEEKKNRVGTDKEKEITAYHEAGHALIAKLIAKKRVPKVTIIPTTKGAGGYTLINPEERMYETKQGLLDEIAIALGGRVAEEIEFGEDYITSGAGQDLRIVTNIAEKMVKDYGMSKNIGLVNIHELYKDSYGGSTNDLIVQEIRTIINISYQKVQETLLENRKLLDEVSKELLLKETLCEKELDSIIEGNPITTGENKKNEKIKVGDEETVELGVTGDMILERRLLR